MTVLAVILLLLLFAARTAITSRMTAMRQEGTPPPARWRRMRTWLDATLVIGVLALLPSLVSRPQGWVLETVYETFSLLALPLGLLAALTLALALREAQEDFTDFIDQRRNARAEVEASHSGEPLRHTPLSLRQWIAEKFPELECEYDVPSAHGQANLLIRTEHAIHPVYILPEERVGQGLPYALPRVAQLGKDFESNAILWIPRNDDRPPRHNADHQVFIQEGSLDALHRLVVRIERIAKRRHERQEARQARRREREERKNEGPWSRRHSRYAWKRFAEQAPVHPTVRRTVAHRADHRCAVCGERIESADLRVFITDQNHSCSNPDSRLLTPVGQEHTERVEMPDCSQCHYDFPEKFEGCLSRMKPAHIDCWSRRFEAGAQAVYSTTAEDQSTS